ncbi:hypothetical protein [Bacillus sp. MUM 13]|uniref:hypothetical protein n=1 Tax=Bacillus sp. MUM 13 TaxID=1678001 RepID=UPI0008F5E781|nr:hypothetical protein [Bacillus sp. MUM 13]OIK12233.1 hypothetical protein BIV59_09650 [Bacillus sp. MUM 13]
MEYTIIGLLALSIMFIVLSFFKRDRVSKLEDDLEQMTLSHMQDMYVLKKKIKVLEEELLLQDPPAATLKPSAPAASKRGLPINEILRNQVLSLFQQGLSLEQIERQSALSREDIMTVIEEQGSRGYLHE